MNNSTIHPEKITKPMQMLAVWMVGLIILIGLFISGAIYIKEPNWIAPFLCISSLMIICIFSYCMFTLQTKYRTQLQDDKYYSQYLMWERKDFFQFVPENIVGTTNEKIALVKKETWDDREKRRKCIYDEKHGLFLVHTYRPSHIQGQIADISISLFQHGEGPLNKGLVESVEYHLGKKFFTEPVIKTDCRDNFKLEVSAYGPMLCLASIM